MAPYVGAGEAVDKAFEAKRSQRGPSVRPVLLPWQRDEAGRPGGMNRTGRRKSQPLSDVAKRLVCVYFVSWLFFHYLCTPLWDNLLRHSGHLLDYGAFPRVSAAPLSAAFTTFAALTHTVSLAAGYALAWLLVAMLQFSSSKLVPVAVEGEFGQVMPSPVSPLLRVIATHVFGVAAMFALFVPAIAAVIEHHVDAWRSSPDEILHATRAFLGERPIDAYIQQGDRGAAEVMHAATMGSYGAWFLVGAALQRRDAAEGAGGGAGANIATALWGVAAALLWAVSAGAVGQRGCAAVASLGVLALLYRRAFLFREKESMPTFTDVNTEHFKRIRRKQFPPPYPNGWFHLLNSVDIDDGKVKSVAALGRHFACFRDVDGRAGVLHAFCPHVGANLGLGSVTEKGLQCPFHHWTFDRTGRCTRTPTARCQEPRGEALVKRTQAKAYEVREHLGMIFIWFHAEGKGPTWEMKYHKDCADSERMYKGAQRQMVMDQHIAEMSENSCDFFHFNTVHRPMPIAGMSRIFSGRHNASALYPPDRDDGDTHVALFQEIMEEVYFLDKYRVPVISGNTGGANVVFEGPSIVHFEIQAIPSFLGKLRMIKTLCPIEPFKIKVETRWFAEYAPPHVINLMANIAVGGLEQDRGVWATKIFRREPHLVEGDGPMRAYREWWNAFYSENSDDMDKPEKLDW